jgi:hypothetical protein
MVTFLEGTETSTLSQQETNFETSLVWSSAHAMAEVKSLPLESFTIKPS